ncbi:aminopeptidase [Methanocella sp. MCL-LM]|uniref:aminopeptidase n=1 Tax=Methanocella sp. MCL-LM TaxID=3412035 RepID=UPI003C71BD4B
MRKDEEVLIVGDLEGESVTIGRAFFDETLAMGGKPVLALQEVDTQYTDGERLVLDAIRAEPDVLITVSSGYSGNDPHGYHIGYLCKDNQIYDHALFRATDGDRRTRGLVAEGASIDMLCRCVDIDYEELARTAALLMKALTGRKLVLVTSPAGTDVTFSIEGRIPDAEDGHFRHPGAWGDLPCGEVRISPANGSANGKIVFDGTVTIDDTTAVPESPVVVTVEDGFAIAIEGGSEAAGMLETIKAAERMAREKGLENFAVNVRNLGEFAFGINPKAIVTGNLLEDEKQQGTVHFALGYNYDNDANAFIHMDCVVLKPSVWVDEKQIMRDGELL